MESDGGEPLSALQRRIPNFFIVGAPKAGTTSLYHHLAQHPDVFMSPMKETSYFSSEFRVERLAPELQHLGRRNAESLRRYLDGPLPLGERFGGMVSDWQDYCRLFAGARDEAVVGEASPGYLWSPTAAGRIASTAPGARILMVLRNPIDRAFSQYLQMSITGLYEVSFEAHLRACQANTRKQQISVLHPFLEYGLYSEQVRRYLDAFPREQLGIWLYEETQQAGFLPGVFEFLGVDPAFRPNTYRRYLEQSVPRSRWFGKILARPAIKGGLRSMVPEAGRKLIRRALYRQREAVTMSAEAKSILVEYYRRDIARLSDMLQFDLSAWAH